MKSGEFVATAELEPPIYRHAETKLLAQFPQVAFGHALGVWPAHIQTGAVAGRHQCPGFLACRGKPTPSIADPCGRLWR
jgi:hypothetical protein